MGLQIFMQEKYLKQTLIRFVAQNYYPQVISKNYKYIEKEKKAVFRYIYTDSLKFSFDYSTELDQK